MRRVRDGRGLRHPGGLRWYIEATRDDGLFLDPMSPHTQWFATKREATDALAQHQALYSEENRQLFSQYLAAIGKKGGQAKSAKKTAANRAKAKARWAPRHREKAPLVDCDSPLRQYGERWWCPKCECTVAEPRLSGRF